MDKQPKPLLGELVNHYNLSGSNLLTSSSILLLLESKRVALHKSRFKIILLSLVLGLVSPSVENELLHTLILK